MQISPFYSSFEVLEKSYTNELLVEQTGATEKKYSL